MDQKPTVMVMNVESIERGGIEGVNRTKGLVTCRHFGEGSELSYWTPLTEAPRPGDQVQVSVMLVEPL